MSNIFQELLKKKSEMPPPVQTPPNVRIIEPPKPYIPPPTPPTRTYVEASVQDIIKATTTPFIKDPSPPQIVQAVEQVSNKSTYGYKYSTIADTNFNAFTSYFNQSVGGGAGSTGPQGPAGIGAFFSATFQGTNIQPTSGGFIQNSINNRLNSLL